MARILPLNGQMWCADMVWRDYGTRPGGAKLRAEGRLAHATHYVRYPGRPQSAAFITISRNHARGSLNSLAIATAAVLGPLAYAEFDMGGGDLWVIATDDDGELLPGSDQFYNAETIVTLREALTGQSYTSRHQIAEHELEAWFSRLANAPITLHPVSLRTFYTVLAAIAVIGLISAIGWSLYSAREAERLAREAREAALRNAKPSVVPSGPAEIIAACMQAITPIRPHSHGWALASLQCDQGGLNTRWIRVGGTLLDAPPGHISSNADTDDLSTILHPRTGRAGTPQQGDPIRLFVGMLQTAGVSPAITIGKAQTTGATAQSVQIISVRFPWYADPRAIAWNSFPRLDQVRLRRTLLTPNLGAATDGYDITATFAIVGAKP